MTNVAKNVAVTFINGRWFQNILKYKKKKKHSFL